MQSEDIDEDDEDNAGIIVHHEDDDDKGEKPQKNNILPINKSVLITVYLITFALWNWGSTGLFFVFGISIDPVWMCKDAGEVIVFELKALISAGFQSYAFGYICLVIHGFRHGFDKLG